MIIQVDQEGFNAILKVCDQLHRAAGIGANQITSPLLTAITQIKKEPPTENGPEIIKLPQTP
jgi:hypothetical protein